jgi:thiol-disulfide isomerase/thioredoxin
MRPFRVLWIFLLSIPLLQAQKKARDFQVTTTDRAQISLYRDFLDKGKVVMIKIFFVDCPPCNDIAPEISQLYKKYGSGKQKVEFIELSNKTWDSDAAVIGYKLKYDLPCPSASNDGGSVQAAALYSDNFYGPFFGTPTFIVIKPDGNLQYDVRGSGETETITRLDTAIAQAVRSSIPIPVDTTKPKPPTDTIKPPPPIPPVDTTKPKPPVDTMKPVVNKVDTIEFAGKLIGVNGQGLGKVIMTLNWNNKEYRWDTDLFGNFKILLVDSLNSTASATWSIDYNLAYNEDVSVLDMLAIQKHILGVSPFANYKKLLAADTNSDGDISALDLLELRKIILGITEKLPNNTPSVYFLFQNANNLIKSIANPLNYNELKALHKKPINIEVVKTGKVN